MGLSELKFDSELLESKVVQIFSIKENIKNITSNSNSTLFTFTFRLGKRYE